MLLCRQRVNYIYFDVFKGIADVLHTIILNQGLIILYPDND